MKVKVAGATLNQIPIDWTGNKKRILSAIDLAQKENVSVLCLPELSITGYGCEDVFFNINTHQKSLEILFELLPSTQNLVTVLGLPIMFQGNLFNCVAVVANGQLLGFVPKKNLAREGVHYETRWFKAWPVGHVRQIELHGQTYPIGDLYFDFSGLKLGLEICEEAWTSQRPGYSLAQRGVDLILNPSASHFSFGKLKVRQRFVSDGSRAFNVGYIYSNLVGNEAGRIIYDGGVLIADGGEIIAQGERFTYKEASITSEIIDVDRNRVVRSRTTSQDPDLSEKDNLCIVSHFKIPLLTNSLPKKNSETLVPAWENSKFLKEEEFSRAVALGLFDFLRKSRQNGFVISLSGGIDSSAVTLLCRLSLDFAVQDIGFENLKIQLAHTPYVSQAKDLEDLAKEYITCAYQATENSSLETLEAARAIATEAGATFYEWSVNQVLKNYLDIYESAFKEKLSWDKDDTTLQNIQARVRGPGIWILANVKKALLLSTSNRSEAAVGYATMDGDTCGCISPIGGVDKNFLRQWAQWMKDFGPTGLKPFLSFKDVLSQPPTAELRPPDHQQTDEEDLMPYDILDAIETLAIHEKKSPLECFLSLSNTVSDQKKLKSWVIKFFQLWCRNQWKRERYAPAFHLDNASLDPKTWCRFPIIMSGYQEEIKELENYRAE